MVKILMRGCNGKMGQVISKLAVEDENLSIVAGIDMYDGIDNYYPVFKTLKECNVKYDVIIDFSTASAVEEVLHFVAEHKLPLVLCTTGLSNKQLEIVKETSKKVPMLRSSNMSIGVNLLIKILKEAVRTLSPEGFDVEIVEKHHNQKLDAPSGTAIALADSMNEEMDNAFEYVYDRSAVRKKRDKKELGISSVRGGNIVGEHDVIFAGTDEVITISHTAYSKAIFAKGALAAAKFLHNREPGLYDMSNAMK